MALMSALRLTTVSTTTALQAASSMGTHGPPKGHPVPVAMPVSMPSLSFSFSTNESISIQRGDR